MDDCRIRDCTCCMKFFVNEGLVLCSLQLWFTATVKVYIVKYRPALLLLQQAVVELQQHVY